MPKPKIYGERIKSSISLEPALHARAVAYAKAANQSLSQWVAELLAKELNYKIKRIKKP